MTLQAKVGLANFNFAGVETKAAMKKCWCTRARLDRFITFEYYVLKSNLTRSFATFFNYFENIINKSNKLSSFLTFRRIKYIFQILITNSAPLFHTFPCTCILVVEILKNNNYKFYILKILNNNVLLLSRDATPAGFQSRRLISSKLQAK